MRGANVTTSRRPFGATTLLTGIEIEPPDRGTVAVTGRSATVVPTGVVVAPEASAAATVAAAIVDALAVEGDVAVVVGVVVVTPVVVVSVGNDTVGRLTGNGGTVIVVGRSPSAAAVGGLAARR